MATLSTTFLVSLLTFIVFILVTISYITSYTRGCQESAAITQQHHQHTAVTTVTDRPITARLKETPSIPSPLKLVHKGDYTSQIYENMNIDAADDVYFR